MGAPEPDALSVAILGTGIMGGAMARRAVAAGLSVCGWSVPIADAERLAQHGVAVAASPRAAVEAADLVVTMVPDAKAIESFASGTEGFLENMRSDAVWIQSSTIGVGPTERLIALASERRIALVDAPVLGSRGPAERGELVVLASGDDGAIGRCDRFFESIARRVLRVGPVGMGSRLKLVCNQWIMAAVASIAESCALAEALGVPRELLLQAMEGTEMDMGYLQIKGRMMAARDYPTQVSIAISAKDAQLALEAALERGLPARVSRAVSELMAAAGELRGGGEDMAVAFEAARAGGGAADGPLWDAS